MRQDQWLNTVTLHRANGTVVPLGVWDTLGGGNADASETKYRPGGMSSEVSLGGPVSIGNITLGRLLDKNRGDWDLIRELMSAQVGKARCDVSRQPLDDDGNPYGKPLNYSGKLQSVNPGDTDSNATAAQVWQIVVSTDGSVA